MVAMFTGLGAGAERGSGNVLGNAGMLWSSGLGRANERVHVNAATGNLLIQQQDEMLIGRGPDVAVGRTYNSLGDLSDENGDNWRQSTDRRVYGLTGTANASGSTVKRVSADGSEITYAWNASAAAYVATDGAGAYDRLTWSGSNATWNWTDGDSQQAETYGYSAGSGRYLITRATDTRGNSLTFSYLSGGKLNKVTTADGGFTQYGWSGNTITQIVTGYTDYASNSAKTLTRTRYGYDASNRLTTVTVDLSPTDNSVSDGKTYVTSYTYDGTSKRVASITQTDGSSLAITYDSALRVKTLEQTAASGVMRITSLDYQSGYTSVTDPTGQITRLDYDNKGQLTKITAPPAANGATAQVTQFAYNANGDVTSVTDPLGNVTSYAAFTANGLAQTVTDRLGNATTRTFGSKNEILTETRTAADQSGAAVQQTGRWVYDSNNRVRFELSPDGNVVEHRYDDSSGKGGVEVLTLTYTAARYDVGGLSATATPSLSQMTSWASNADKTQISQRSYTYDARGNMTASYGYGTLDSAGAGSTQDGVFYTYDQAGQLLSTNSYAHAAETYVYDGMGRVVSSVDLAGGTTSIVFNDAASSTVVTLAAGLVRTSTYNKAGELVSLGESGANTATGTATYRYDALGRMRMATGTAGQNSYVIYDKAGRKVADVDHYGAVTEYRYDADDRVVGETAYANYLTTAQLATLADPLAHVDIAAIRPTANSGDRWAWTVYDKEGRVLQTIDGTGRTVANAYDASGRLVRSTAYYNLLTATQLSGFRTTPPTAVTLPTADSARDAVSRTFYDRTGRMVGMLDGEGFLTRIDYDAGGRKVAETAFATATTASNRANGSFSTLAGGLADPAADRTTRMVYDGLGQMVFRIDALNRVTEMVYPNGDAADVNGLARRTIRYAGSIPTPSNWTVAGVRAALNSAGLPDQADNRSTWAIYDNRDNLAYAIDATGAVTGYRYDTSGNVTKVTRYATPRSTGALPSVADMDSWAEANASAGDDRVTRHWYNARSELRYVVDGEGFVTRTDFDTEGRAIGTAAFANAISVTDTTGYAQVAAAATGPAITTATAYDMRGRIKSQTDGNGVVTTYAYDASGGLLGRTQQASDSADQSVISYGYDAAGRVVTRIDGFGTDDAATTTMAYDGLGNLIVTTDPNDNSVTATYDRAGRRVTQTDGEGLTTRYAYNAFDQVVAVTDARGQTAYNHYDLTGRTTTTRDAIGRVTATTYNAFGEATRSTRYANAASNTASAATLPNVTADSARDAVTSWTYDKAGRITAIADAEAAVTTQSYNAFGEMVSRVDPLDARGVLTTMAYDRRGLLKTRIVDAASGGKALTTSYGYDAFGREVTLVDARGGTVTVTRGYDGEGRLTSTTDALGNVTAYAYDKRGNLAAVTDAKGAVTRYAYDALDRRVYTVDALGGVVRTEYDKAGNAIRTTGYAAPIALAGLSAVTTAAAITARVSADAAADKLSRSIYDRDNRLRFTVDGAGSLTEKVYDGADNPVRTLRYPVAIADNATFTVAGMQAAIAAMTAADRAAAPVTRNVFDASGQRVYGIDASGFVTAFTYDSRGNKTSERRFVTAYTGADDPTDAAMASWAAANADAGDRVTRALYDREDRLRIDVDAEGYVTQYAYDQASHLIQKTRYPDRYPAIDGTTTLDQAGALIGTTPPATAQVTAYAYDSAGRLESETRDAGAGRLNQVTTFVSDANGNVVAQTDVAGRTTRYVYDAANRRIAMVDALGGVTAMGYDALGRVAWTRDYATPIARATLDAYPPAITLAQASVPAAANDRVTRSFHDAAGRQAFAVDGEGFVTERRYDSVGNLATTIRYAAAIPGLTDATTTAELAALLPAAIPADAAVTRYAYDRTSRLTDRAEADGGVTHIEYDALGNAVRTTVAYGTADAATTTRTFDKRGQIVREVGAGATTGTDYGYNAFGERISSTDPLSFGVTTTYDRLGRTTSETVPVGAAMAGLATTSVYDAFGRVVQVTDPQGNSGYFHYDNLGRLTVQVDAEGYVTQTNWTPTGQKDSVIRYAERAVSPGNADTMPVVYGSGADAITSFGYDRLDRLVATTDARGNTERYVLDTFGDRVAVVNKLGGVTFNSYDRRGLLVEEMTQVRWTDPARGLAMGSNIANSYAYDARGNLSVKVEAAGRPEARTTRYTYDGLDRMTETIGDVVEVLVDPEMGTTAMVAPTTRMTYDLRGNLIERVDANGARSLTYYDGQNRKIAELSAVGSLITWQYDGAGNAVLRHVYGDPVALPATAGGTPPVPVNAANVRETAYAYDRNNRLVSTSVAAAVAGRYDGTSYVTVQGVTTAVAYDGLGNVVREIDGNGTVVLHWFDRLGREIGKVDGEGYLTSWVRDAEGNVTAERRYANRVGGTYSEATPLATVIGQTVADAANDRVTLFAYNRNGQRIREERLGVTGLMDGATGTEGAATSAVIRYTYNALGEVLSKHEATGDVTQYTYDDSGRLIRRQDAAIGSLGGIRRTTDFAYDDLNNLLTTRESGSVNTSAPVVFEDIVPATRPVPVPVTTASFGIATADGYSRVHGSSGNDYMYMISAGQGGANNFGLEGGDGDDWLINESWNGMMDGGAGNDVLEFRTFLSGSGGAGSDYFVFDLGNLIGQQFIFSSDERWGEITDFTPGVDKIAVLNAVSSFADLMLVQNGADTEVRFPHAPRIILRNTDATSLTAADFVIDRAGFTGSRPIGDRIPTPLITNTLIGTDREGTAANDRIILSGSGHGTAFGGRAGDDHLVTNQWLSTVSGGDGNDLIEVRNVGVLAIGGSGNDTFIFDDSVFSPNDWIRNPQYDWGTIPGFTPGHDRIVIPGRSFAELTFTQVGGDVHVTMANAPRIVLQGLTVAEIQSSDFTFSAADPVIAMPERSAAPTTEPMTPAATDRVNAFVYGAGGRLVSQTDATGFARSFAYDAVGRVLRESYDRERSNGDVVTEGRFTQYDAVGRAVGSYAGSLSNDRWYAGDLSSTGYDAFGDAVFKAINSVVQERNVYDALGRVVKTNARDGVWREYGYDGNANATLTVASNGFDASAAPVGALLTRGLAGQADAVVTYAAYDRRNLGTASYEIGRQLGLQVDGSSAAPVTLSRTQAHNAFGEVVSDVDPRGATTSYRYNSIGKLIERSGPTVTVTLADTSSVSQSATDRFYYDLSGRAIGTRDANGHLTRRTLLEGRGYGDEEALALVEYRPDASTTTREYNVFGDAIAAIDGLGRRTDRTFDKLGRLLTQAMPGTATARLTDTYAYDGLGQRIRHSNSVYQAPVVGQTYPYYDEVADGTFYLSPSGRYLIRGDTGGAAGTNKGLTMPVSYPATGPEGRRWVYDSVRGYAVLLPAGATTYESPEDDGEGGSPGLVVAGVETTDYDLQGRVVANVDFAGDLTSYSYQWSGTAQTAGLGVTGGWVKTVSTSADRFGVDGAVAASEATDSFGHVQQRTDQGGNLTQITYDLTGRGATETHSGPAGSRTVSFGYNNTGLLASVTEAAQTATYGYDASGNWVYERLVAGSTVKQDGRATYDLLGRMTSWTDLAADGGAANAALSWSYDAVGNIRSLTQNYRPMDPTGLSSLQSGAQTRWYLYDAMNRVVLDQGEQSGNAIVRGSGVSLIWDAAGQRVSATTAMGVTTAGEAGTASSGEHRERYVYSDDGQLVAVYQSDAVTAGSFGSETLLASYQRDALGRVLSEQQYDPDGVTVARSRYGIAYDNRGRVTAESATQRRGSETYNSYATNWYNPDGTLSSSAVQSWKDGGGTTSNATTSYRYVWRDGPLTSAVTLTNTDGTTQSLYGYDDAGRLLSVTLTGGTRPRTVAVTTDLSGQILTRDELPQYTNAPTANPHEKRYIFDGAVMGEVGNDGSDNTTFAAAVAQARATEPESTTANPAGPFRNGAFSGAAYADFDQNYDAVNYRSVATTPQSYTVRGGDTLAGIAQTVWGDANLWYLIAGANGLTADETLVEGRVLSIPSTVVNRGNTTDTWRPYDPAEALGDVRPNTPVPQPRAAQGGRRNRCGILGTLLLAVVAIAVTVVTAGAAVAALVPSIGSLGAGISTVLGGGVAGALGGGIGGTLGAIAIGAGSAAVGSAVSQGVGVATGLQDQFSFRGVALAAISGGVSAGIGNIGLASRIGGGVVGAAVSGAAGNVLTQGIAVATGLQRRFDWAGVAASGVTGAVGYATAPRGSSFGTQLLSGAASGVAGAATRSLVEGTSFGDNILAVLPDVIGTTVGRLAAQAVGEASLRSGSRVPRLAVDPAALDDDGVVTGGAPVALERRIAELRASGRITAEAATQMKELAAEIKSRLAEQQTEQDRANSQRVTGIGSDGKPNLVTRDAGYAIDLSTLEARVQAYDAQYGTGRYSVDGKRQFDAAIANNGRLIEQWDRTAESQVNRLFGGFLLGSAGGALVGVAGTGLVATASWGVLTTGVANAGVAGLSSTVAGLGYRPALGETNTTSSLATDFASGVVGYGVGSALGRVGSSLLGTIGLGRTSTEREVFVPLSRAAVRSKIIGTAQQTGNDGAHAFRSYREAILLARNPEVGAVYLNRGYNAGLGLAPKTISPNRRPDVLARYFDGRVDRVEVFSKTDVDVLLRSRNTFLDPQIRASGYMPLPPRVVYPVRGR